MPNRAVAKLTVHPFNREIYGDPDATGLTESLEEFGLEYPIEIDGQERILSGARRWKAAKELGWKEIEVRELRLKDEAAIRKHILLANAYRSAKTVFVRQKEADAYRDFLARGEMTKEELAHLARQQGKAPSTGDELRPQRLAAAAAGMSASTYQQAAYVTDRTRGEAEIDRAAKNGLIGRGQASTLRRELSRIRNEFKQDKISADRAAGEIRQRLHDAHLEHGYSEEERFEKAANDAALEAIHKGRAFVAAIDVLGHSQYVKHLGPRAAFILAGTVYEARLSLERLAQKRRISLPTSTTELHKLGSIDNPESEVMGQDA